MSFTLTQMTSVPTSLTAKKTMKMKFFSKKIYCNSSWNVLKIANMQNPKWLYMHCKPLKGASVAKWSNYSPFTFEVAGPIPSSASHNVTPNPVSCEKGMSTLCRKSWVFSGYPSSSHKESWQGWLGDAGPPYLAYAVVVYLPLWPSK